MIGGGSFERAADAGGFAECRRCHAREQLAGNNRDARAAAFMRRHKHGAVLIVTPYATTKALLRPSALGARAECHWCGALATTTDEDGDPSCAQHASEDVRPEVLR